jgi:predicted HicB family RNase H-like nuclease
MNAEITHAQPSGKLNLRLPRSLHAELTELAAADGVSLNQWIVTALARQAEVAKERAA